MTPSNAELVQNILFKYPGTTQTPVNPVAVEELVSLFQAREQKILTELLGHKVNYYERLESGGEYIDHEAVPVEVIKRGGL